MKIANFPIVVSGFGALVFGGLVVVVVMRHPSSAGGIRAIHSNYSGTFRANYEGTGRLRSMCEYVNGQKHGKEIWWYEDPSVLMSLLSYSNGVLYGECVRYQADSNHRILASGRFVAGKPWEGTFFAYDDGTAFTNGYFNNLFADARFPAVEYKHGQMTKRFVVP